MYYKKSSKNNLANLISCVIGLTLVACNGGSSSSTSGGGSNPVIPLIPPTNANLSVSVTPNPGSSLCGAPNIPCVTVTVCNPNSPSQCDTIPNVIIDSGSYGLRVFSSLLVNTGNSLPIESSNGNQIAECLGYADFAANWGPVALANITLNTESTTQSVPMQIINASYVGASSNCAGSINYATPAAFGANGILGVGPLINDNGDYFICGSSSCVSIPSGSLESASQVSNPIAFLSESYESGITFKFPSVTESSGGSGAIGYAIFGVGTNTDNKPNDTAFYHIHVANEGIPISMYTTITSSNISNSVVLGFLDTGSNGIFFTTTSISTCGDWYCPSNAETITVNNASTAGDVPTSFTIANANSLFGTNNGSFSSLGGQLNDHPLYLDYGLSFFFGRSVFICFNGKTCDGVAGPYWAF